MVWKFVPCCFFLYYWTGFPPEKCESIMVTGGSGLARRALSGVRRHKENSNIKTSVYKKKPLVVTYRTNIYPLFALIHHFL